MFLGVIADDFTGATDIASMLVRSGLRTIQTIGVPQGEVTDADAVVVALKSRTCAVDDAVRDSLAALRWLQAGQAQRFYFKYCSTFDSTPAGNIGPVTEALMGALGAEFTIACPALPDNGRSVYQGHLFVGDRLLNESGMQDHPLTPMKDANLVRVLQAQVSSPVGLAAASVVQQGESPLRAHLDDLKRQGFRFAVVDAIANADLFHIAAACDDLPLITGGSGVALGLPAAYSQKRWVTTHARADALPTVGGGAVVFAGSCSQATRSQVAHWHNEGRPAFRLDPMALASGAVGVQDALRFWQSHRGTPVLFYATAEPDAVRAAQQALGTACAGEWVERTLAELARELVQRDVRRWVIAGGETSGAVVQALQVQQLRIGPTITPGVPWTQALGRPLLLALKSGNFGGPGFFSQALAMSA